MSNFLVVLSNKLEFFYGYSRLGGYKYLEVGLWPQHVEQELAQPPHHRVPVQPGQPAGGTLSTGIVLQYPRFF
jgi:hypothetical protein